MLKDAGFNKDLSNALAGHPVPYLSAQDRQQYEVTVGEEDGLLYQQRDGEAEPAPMDTSDAVNPQGAYLYGMSKHGEVFAAPSTTVEHHSSFFAGNPGASFGSMKVEQGHLQRVTDSTGHYAIPLDYSRQMPKELEARGADLSQMETAYEGLEKKELKKRMKQVGLENERLYPEGPQKKRY